MTWEYWPSQVSIAKEANVVLREHGLVYLAMEERTGKCGTAMAMCEDLNVQRVLVITKKTALEGWQEALKNFPHEKAYVLINYHSAHKVSGKFDLAILDESHSYISGYPLPSDLWKQIYKMVYGLPLIYSSATPYAEGPQLLYHQFKLSAWGPWKQFRNFYDWFKHYADRDEAGNLRMTYIGAQQQVIDYSKVKADEIIASVKHLFISYTRKELGFKEEPKDQLHFIELSEPIKKIYNHIVEKKTLTFDHAETGKEYKLVCDTPAKFRFALHMLEGGTLKIDEEYINLGNNEKADYILKTWGDSGDLVIMYHYIADRIKLERMFKRARILQGTTYAEGVDLSMYKHLVIYSQDFSTAKHTQRRARQANRKRTDPINVHYLLVKGACSHKAYQAVSIKKKNFIDTVFERI